jgi:hypothetical protein
MAANDDSDLSASQFFAESPTCKSALVGITIFCCCPTLKICTRGIHERHSSSEPEGDMAANDDSEAPRKIPLAKSERI